jgi:hypothetical protein
MVKPPPWKLMSNGCFLADGVEVDVEFTLVVGRVLYDGAVQKSRSNEPGTEAIVEGILGVNDTR